MRIRQRFTTQEKIIIFLFILLIIALLATDYYLPDPNPKMIRTELQQQGYDVENVDFELVRRGDRFRERIYQSSIPIHYEGNDISQWTVARYSFFYGSIRYNRVEPYLPDH